MFLWKFIPMMWLIMSKGRGRNGVGGVGTQYKLNIPGYESQQGKEIFSSPKPLPVGSIQLPVYWVLGLFLRGKAAGCEDGHSHPSNGRVKCEWSYTSAACNVLMAWTGVTLAFSFYLRGGYCWSF
jgi:hypothetical protein